MSTLLITISRTELALTPLVLSGTNDANLIGVTSFTEPARVPDIEYAPTSNLYRDVPLSVSYRQGVLGFDVVTHKSATEQASQDLLDDLRDALGQFAYTTTTVINSASAKVWTCNTGAMSPIERTLVNLKHFNPVASVTIPCYPIPGSA